MLASRVPRPHGPVKALQTHSPCSGRVQHVCDGNYTASRGKLGEEQVKFGVSVQFRGRGLSGLFLKNAFLYWVWWQEFKASLV